MGLRAEETEQNVCDMEDIRRKKLIGVKYLISEKKKNTKTVLCISEELQENYRILEDNDSRISLKREKQRGTDTINRD